MARGGWACAFSSWCRCLLLFGAAACYPLLLSLCRGCCCSPCPLQELEQQLAEIERDVRMLSKATSVRVSTS